MSETRYWVQLATEQFPPSDLVRQAQGVERAGFQGLNVSDHFQPWWEPGHSGHAWALLGAIGQATQRVLVGTGVTAPVYRHNPAVTAQFAATMEEMCPGRAFLGVGSGEALNEVPCGMDWPSVAEQVDRMEEALEPDRTYRSVINMMAGYYRDLGYAEEQFSDEDFVEQYIVSADPEHHAERIREVEKLGATVVCLQNASGADPHAALGVYGDEVLPALRGVRA